MGHNIKALIRKIFALPASIMLAVFIAKFLGSWITKENGMFFSWDYLTLNKTGLLLYCIGFFAILIGGYERKNIGILLELLSIMGVILLFPKYCITMEKYSFFRSVLDLGKGIFVTYLFAYGIRINAVFEFLTMVMVDLIFYRIQYWFYLIFHEWFNISVSISLLITMVVLLLIYLLIFFSWNIWTTPSGNNSQTEAGEADIEGNGEK